VALAPRLHPAGVRRYGVCAPLAIEVAVGPDYHGALELFRILSVGGAVGVLSTFLGTILVAKGLVRIMLWQNGMAVVFNVAGNLLLVPRFGVAAAAWLSSRRNSLSAGRPQWPSPDAWSCAHGFGYRSDPTITLAGGAATAIVLGRWQVGSHRWRPGLPRAARGRARLAA
jgi:hypothetical protein